MFADPVIVDKVVAQQHTIDRREVEAKRALPKDESPVSKDQQAVASGQRTKKIFVGGLAATVDESTFRSYFEEFGTVEDAVVMYDHENKRPRGFGFITFADEDAVDKVFTLGTVQVIHEKQIEIKRAVPRDSMPSSPRTLYRPQTTQDYEGRSPTQGGRYANRGGGSYHTPVQGGPPGAYGGRKYRDGARPSPVPGLHTMNPGGHHGYSPPPVVVTGIPATMAAVQSGDPSLAASTLMGSVGGIPGSMAGIAQSSPLGVSRNLQRALPLGYSMPNGMQGSTTLPHVAGMNASFSLESQQAAAAQNLADLQQASISSMTGALEQLHVHQHGQRAEQIGQQSQPPQAHQQHQQLQQTSGAIWG